MSILPDSWNAVPCSEIATVNPSKGTISVEDGQLAHFVPMAKVVAEFGGIDVSTVRPVREIIKGYTAFRGGDVLFAKITPCMENGKIAVVPALEHGIGFGSTEFHVIRPFGEITSKWLANYFSRVDIRKRAQRCMTGSAGQLRVPASWIADENVPVAPVNEQRRIVEKLDELFSDLDAGVAALERIRAKLKRYRAAVLKAAVEGKLTADWRAKHPNVEPAADLLKRILAVRRRKWEDAHLAKFAEAGKEPPKGWREKYQELAEPDVSALPPLPAEWCWTTLEAIAEVVGGITKDKKREDEAGVLEIPYLRVANVQRGVLDLSEIKTIFASKADLEELRLIRGDILFTEGGDRDKLGRGWVWEEEIPDCIHQNHIFRARLFGNGLLPKLVSHHGNTFGQLWFNTAGKQTTNLASINMGILRRFPVPVAPAAEQSQIDAEVEQRLSIVDTIAAQVEANLKRSGRLRQSILKRAFEGKLVAQVATDEPASILLERIRRQRGQPETANGGSKPPKRNRGSRSPKVKSV